MLRVEVNGSFFDGFSEISMVDDITQLCNQFVLKCTFSDEDFYPIYRDSLINIYNGDIKMMTGIVEKISGKSDSTTTDVSVSGRDVTRDILKNDVPPGLKFNGPITLKSVMKKSLRSVGLNYEIIDKAGDDHKFSKKEILTADIGDSIWDFWMKLAKKSQVLITKDEDGNLVILNPQQDKYETTLLRRIHDPNGQNNILESNWDFDDSDRRREYNVYSQANVSVKRDIPPPIEAEYWSPVDDNYTDASIFLKRNDISDTYKGLYNRFSQIEDTDSKEYIEIKRQLNIAETIDPVTEYVTRRTQTSGKAIDSNVPTGSVSHEVAEDPSDDSECLRQAKWKANQARVNSVKYSCTVSSLTVDKKPWKAGWLIDVADEKAQIQAEMLIQRAEYTPSVTENGDANEKVLLTLTLPDAYTKTAEAGDSQKQTNIIGSKWNNGDFQ
jgi:prophage tail gpP-like protein